MEFLVFISYIILAFLLFLFLNLVTKKFLLTRVEFILFTNIFLITTAGIFKSLKCAFVCDNLFIVVVLEFLIRMIYTTYLLEIDFFEREEKRLSLYLLNVCVSYLLNQLVINKVNMVFLSPEELKFLLWVFIILFLYQFFHTREGVICNKEIDQKKLDFGSKKQYIVFQYTRLKQKYGKYINVKDELRFLMYAIMIYENYKRPNIFRQIDYICYQFSHIPKKQGIMQIDSKKIISDIESIEIVEQKIKSLYSKQKNKNKIVNILDLLAKMGKKKEDIEQIEKIYQYLIEFSEL